MIRLKYSQVSNQNLAQAIQKLARSPMRMKTAYNVKRLVDKLQSARREIATEFERDILGEYAEKDENGKVKYTDGNPSVPVEKEEAFFKAQEAFGEKTYTLDRDKLSARALMDDASVMFSPADLAALDAIVEEDLDGPVGGVIPHAPGVPA